MRTLTGFTSEQARQNAISSGRITASQAANLPIETSAISSNIPNNSLAITPSSLQPITPLTVPTNQPITSDSAITGSMVSNMTASTTADTLMQTEQGKADTSSNALTDLYSQLTGVNTSLGNVNSSVDRTAQNEARLQADRYTAQILSEQTSARRRIEALQNTNPTGMLEGGLNSEVNRINRESLSKQADLSLLQMASSNDYANMAAVSDEMVKNNLSQLTAQAENLKMFIDQNQSNLSKAEQNLFNLQSTKVDAELKKQTEIEETIKDLKINVAQFAGSEAGSILNKLSKAKTIDEALIIAGKYVSDPLDRQIKLANLNKLKADTAKTNAEADQAKKLGNLINLDPTSKTYTDQMIDGSKGGRVLTQSEVLPITKGLTVVNQIGALQQTLKGQDTGPILGILRDNNPYDIKAKLINAQLQSLIPNLARGVYGEVGVLTNTDIDNYKQTLGNIKTPEEANNLLLAMTLSTIKSSLDNNFQTMAAAGRDVSGFKGIYSNLKTQLDTLNNNLGVSQISNNANSYLDSALPQETPAPSGPVSWLNTFFYGKKK